MVVCGKYCHILSRSGINATVSMFTNNVGTLQIPIVDAVITYNCSDTDKVWPSIVQNVLFAKDKVEVLNIKEHAEDSTKDIESLQTSLDKLYHKLQEQSKATYIETMF